MTIAQIASVVVNTVFVVVLGSGYYFLFKVNHEMLREMRAQRTAMGRPQAIVDNDYDRLPEVDIAVRNISDGAAKEITFKFSAPVEASGGFVVSDLPYFKDGSRRRHKGDREIQGPGRGVLRDRVEPQPFHLQRSSLRSPQGHG